MICGFCGVVFGCVDTLISGGSADVDRELIADNNRQLLEGFHFTQSPVIE